MLDFLNSVMYDIGIEITECRKIELHIIIILRFYEIVKHNMEEIQMFCHVLEDCFQYSR